MRAIARRPAAAGVTLALIWCVAPGPEAQRVAPPRSGPPPVLWRAGDVRAHGRPAVDEARVYTLTADHEVVALVAATGAIAWRQSTAEPGEASNGSAATIAGSVIVAGDFNLVAFDRVTGTKRWRFVPAVGYAPGVFLGQSSNGLVFAGSGSGRLYAVRAETGELAWSVMVASNVAASVFAPATDGRVVAAGYTEWQRPALGGVALFDAASGRLLWRTPFPPADDPLQVTAASGGPVISGDAIIATRGDGVIFALDRGSGAVKWTLASIDTIPDALRGPLPLPPIAKGPDYRPLTVSGSLLVAGSLKGDVMAWDLATRRRRWHFADPSLGSVSYGISSDSDSVYVPFGAGRQVALSLRTGAERWRTDMEAGAFIWPAASDRARVFIGGKGGVNAIRR